MAISIVLGIGLYLEINGKPLAGISWGVMQSALGFFKAVLPAVQENRLEESSSASRETSREAEIKKGHGKSKAAGSLLLDLSTISSLPEHRGRFWTGSSGGLFLASLSDDH